MKHYYSCPPYYFPRAERNIYTRETSFYQIVSLIAHNLVVVQLLHLVWLAFLRKYLYSVLGLDAVLSSSRALVVQSEDEARQNVNPYSSIEQEVNAKLERLEEVKETTLLYWSFRGLVITLFTRFAIFILRFFIINYFKMVKANDLLVQVAKNEIPLFIIWSQFFYIQLQVLIPPKPEEYQHDSLNLYSK